MNKLKELREKRGLTQEQLARKADVTLATMHNYEKRGTLEKASLQNVKRIARALDVDPAIFLQ